MNISIDGSVAPRLSILATHGTMMIISWMILQPISLLVLISYRLTLPLWNEIYFTLHFISMSVAVAAFAYIFLTVPYCMCSHGELGIIVIVFGLANFTFLQIVRKMLQSDINQNLMRMMVFMALGVNVATEIMARRQLLSGLEKLNQSLMKGFWPMLIIGPVIFHLLVLLILRLHVLVISRSNASTLQCCSKCKRNRGNPPVTKAVHPMSMAECPTQKQDSAAETETIKMLEMHERASSTGIDSKVAESGSLSRACEDLDSRNPLYLNKFRLSLLLVHSITMVTTGLIPILKIWKIL